MSVCVVNVCMVYAHLCTCVYEYTHLCSTAIIKTQGSHFCFHSAGVTGVCIPMPWFLYGCWDSNSGPHAYTTFGWTCNECMICFSRVTPSLTGVWSWLDMTSLLLHFLHLCNRVAGSKSMSPLCGLATEYELLWKWLFLQIEEEASSSSSLSVFVLITFLLLW